MGNTEKIEDLMEKADAEDVRKVIRQALTILAKIDHVLDANVTATRQLAEQMDQHRKDFLAHDARQTSERAYIRGAIWAGLGLVVIIQTLGAWIVTRHFAESDVRQDALIAMDRRLSILEMSVREHHDAVRNGK